MISCTLRSPSCSFRALLPLTGLLLLSSGIQAQQNPEGLVKSGTAKVEDALTLLPPKATRMQGGLLGDRFGRNEKNRLLNVNEEELLAGFQHKPGKQAWIGEHVGKFLHAASLAYANTGDPALRAKIDRVARGLMATQEADGYLGTYIPSQRWGLFPNADWDVWVHKYDLLGLLTYYQYTGNKEALKTCRRVGDLLISVFGPGKKSINSAGTHEGMAATSILEPIVLLYRATGDNRYLSFAKYITDAWEEPKAPHIISTLMREKSVRKTANAKAYEMTSNLSGLCELYRATGDRKYLDPVLIAWEDIVKNRLYITGSGSSHELWQDEYHLPNGNSANICETCVTVSWEQLNIQLLRLTGEPKYADQLERSVYNHLLGAQKPTGDQWCYYTPLQGTKPYGKDTNCCLSSGPRGVALLPSFVYSRHLDGVAVNLFTPSTGTVKLPYGTVEISQETDYPTKGTVNLTVNPKGGAKTFPLLLRVPGWASGVSVAINGEVQKFTETPTSYAIFTRKWKSGDRVTYTLPLKARLILGDHENEGKEALMLGPIVLAIDEGHNPDAKPVTRVESLLEDPTKPFALQPSPKGSQSGEPVYVFPTMGRSVVPAGNGGTGITVPNITTLLLVPFYAAGQDGSRFAVWIQRPGTVATKTGRSLLSFSEETRSRYGNQPGSIVDDDPETFAVTYDASKQAEAWFAAPLPNPSQINRVVFAHGQTFHDGGWFDTSAEKPRVQVKKTKDGVWEDVATLDTYPESTSAKPGRGLRPGAMFTVKFAPVYAYAVRVIGIPSSGDNPAQSFASCGELQAYMDK